MSSNFKEIYTPVDDKNNDETDNPPHSCHVTYLDLGSLLYSFIFHFIDVGFDFYVAYSYYATGKYSHFAWTLAFVLIPSIILTLISIRMYVEDSRSKTDSKHAIVRIILCILGTVFQLALPIRCCDSFHYAIKSLKAEKQNNKKQQEKYFIKMLNEDSDIALLRVFECYLESAPQLTLQITLSIIDYIEGSNTHSKKQIVLIILGLLAMGWCMANYHRCIRFDQEKKNISALGIVVLFFWHLNFTVSRILAITALATLFATWASIAALVHWLTMTIWVSFTSKSYFCGNQVFEIFFYCATGILYIFNFLNMKEGSTKNSYLFFYLLCFVENIIVVTIWGVKATLFVTNWIYYFFIILPVLCFTLSIGFLILYYQYLHPNKLKLGKKNDLVNGQDQKLTFLDEPNK